MYLFHISLLEEFLSKYMYIFFDELPDGFYKLPDGFSSILRKISWISG